MNEYKNPSNAVLSERIQALNKRVDDRFDALDKALRLAETLHKYSVSTWISLAALLTALAAVFVAVYK